MCACVCVCVCVCVCLFFLFWWSPPFWGVGDKRDSRKTTFFFWRGSPTQKKVKPICPVLLFVCVCVSPCCVHGTPEGHPKPIWGLRDLPTQEGLNIKLADMKGAAKGTPQEPKVFIGGIGPMITQEDMYRTCEQFGGVTHCKIFTKNDKSLPCAFVTFASFTEAERCIQSLHDQSHAIAAEGKILVAKMADLAKSAKAPAIPLVAAPVRFERFDRRPAMPVVQQIPVPMKRVQPAPSAFEEGAGQSRELDSSWPRVSFRSQAQKGSPSVKPGT